MRFLGGKSRHGKRISDIVRSCRGPYYEPFCGGLWVTCWLQPAQASDICPWLICLYKSIQNGWEPPIGVTEKQYNAFAREAKDGVVSPSVAFAGYCCSWGGKWFGGYARGADRMWDLEALACLGEKMARCANTNFICQSYTELHVRNSTIYCDPPYLGTTSYKDAFDNHAFWNWCRSQIDRNNIVFISEFHAPSDYVSIIEFPLKTMKGPQSKAEIDKLFVHKDQVSLQMELFAA